MVWITPIKFLFTELSTARNSIPVNCEFYFFSYFHYVSFILSANDNGIFGFMTNVKKFAGPVIHSGYVGWERKRLLLEAGEIGESVR